MFGSGIVYIGFLIAAAGLVLVVRPVPQLRVPTRSRGALVCGAGVLLIVVGLLLPTAESQVTTATTRLDEFAPRWQFREVHSLQVTAPPERVFAAINAVRADEIFLFRTLTWFRRGGRPLPENILDAGTHESLIDVALQGGFVRLAHDPPRELVIGTVVVAPPGTNRTLPPDSFPSTLPPGFVIATMNFVVVPEGPNASVLTTETRVFANSASARRRFAAYWRVIYPGSALIRRMWLRAIERGAKRSTPYGETTTPR